MRGQVPGTTRGGARTKSAINNTQTSGYAPEARRVIGSESSRRIPAISPNHRNMRLAWTLRRRSSDAAVIAMAPEDRHPIPAHIPTSSSLKAHPTLMAQNFSSGHNARLSAYCIIATRIVMTYDLCRVTVLGENFTSYRKF